MNKIKKSKEEIVKVSIDKLKEVAEYYEFPLAVFFTPKCHLKKGTTRNEEIFKSLDALDKIKKIIEDLKEDKK